MNPLVPTPLDAALMAVSLGTLIMTLAAFISLLRSRALSGRRLLAWTLVVLFLPIVGSTIWFAARYRERSIEPGDERSSS